MSGARGRNRRGQSRQLPWPPQTDDQKRLIDDVLRGWFMQQGVLEEDFFTGLRRLGAMLVPDLRLYLVWIQIHHQASAPASSIAQVRAGLGDILQEHFVHYAQDVLLSHLSRYSLGCVIYPNDAFEMDDPGVQRQLERTLAAFRAAHGLQAVCFYVCTSVC